MATVTPECWLTVSWYCEKCDDTYHARNPDLIETMRDGHTVQCECPGCGDTLTMCLEEKIEDQINTKASDTLH